MIKEFVLSQKELWQQVPYWALQANGKLGFINTYQTAYTRKAWLVFSGTRDGFYTLAVDCLTGELIWPHSIGKDSNRDIPDKDVIVANLEELDAAKIIEGLQKSAQGPDLSPAQYGIGYRNGGHWREVIMQKNNILIPEVTAQ